MSSCHRKYRKEKHGESSDKTRNENRRRRRQTDTRVNSVVDFQTLQIHIFCICCISGVDGHVCWNSKLGLLFFVCRPRKTNFHFPYPFSIYIYIYTENGTIYIYILYIYIYIYVNIYIYIDMSLYIYCHFKRKTEAQAFFFDTFTVCSSYKQKLLYRR
jgi:hypothetical protein